MRSVIAISILGAVLCASAAPAVAGSRFLSIPDRSSMAAPSALAARPGGGARVAGWTGEGMRVTTSVYSQFSPAAIPDGSGGAIAAWIENRTLGFDVCAMRLDANGDRVSGWAADGLTLCASDSNEVAVQLARDALGGAFALIMQSGSNGRTHAVAQHVNASGAIVSGWPSNGIQLAEDVLGVGAVDTNDGYLLMGWADPTGQIYVRRLTQAGANAPGWTSTPLAVGSPASSGEVAAAPDGAGGAYIAWYEGSSLMLTRVAAGGGFAAGWTAAGLLVRDVALTGAGVGLERLTGGDALVCWEDGRSGISIDIYAMRVGSNGVPAAGWPAGGVAVNTAAGNQESPHAVSDGAGGAIVEWNDGGTSLVAQRVTSSGAFFAGWPAAGRTLCTGVNPKTESQFVISDDAGGAIVVWSEIVSTDDNVYAQRVASDGTIPSGWPAEGALLSTAPFNQNGPVPVPDGASGAIVFWQGLDATFTPAIFAGHVLVGGTVPALAALVEARAEGGLVRLSWFSPDGPSFVADLERAVGDGAFEVIARVQGDGLGHVAYEDRDVVAGGTYRYRLAVSEDGTRRTFGETSVTVGVAARLSIAGFRPNPAAGEARVAFTLASGERAQLEVLDVTGRRVATREVSGAPGEHVVALGGARLAPGVYVVRLTQGARTVTTRAVVAR
jgi:hypothetical protein